MGKSFYLTTTLPYVNADPHIGFALELVHADILARYRHSLGDDVFFNTGTDEHGLKIYRKAQEEGKKPQAYTDEYAAKFKDLKGKLDLFPGIHFIRTTDANHKKAAQELWRRCLAKGDIYKKKYKGLYCVGDEAFIKESELVNGRCSNHPTMEVIEIEEENYFFRLSAYQEKLLVYLNQEGVIVPEWRRKEAIQFVERGLEDFSISRVKEKMPWGVAVPDDENQVMYVWFDALTNYISTLGWPEDREGLYKKFWEGGETVQLAGKDQVRFQSIMWQAMLMSGGLATTKKIVYHGFITSGGQKMSKSVGNVIDPLAIVDEYGVDALRYFLARHVHPFEDSDFTMERFKEAYNADLANGIGNAAARIMTLAEKHLDKPVEVSPAEFADYFIESMNKYEFNETVAHVTAFVVALDELITSKEPFKLVKSDPESAKTVITDGVRMLWSLNYHLQIFMPDTAQKIQQAIKENKKPENLFPRKE
ncbi:MAG: methionyl-tRNA synthetase [Parcubacteria group bacterium Gr01-1014_8]|nr:MAG: methionyl-tRNA synthetase [Parcubacteria group bacterium Gr01-1014_8]